MSKYTKFPYSLPPESTEIDTNTHRLLQLGYRFLDIDEDTQELVYLDEIDDFRIIKGTIFKYLKNTEDNSLVVIVSLYDSNMLIFLKIPEEISVDYSVEP